jgi:SAM-dependent methyltransferase
MVEVLGLKDGARILDLGCGGGEQSLGLARLGFETVGVDIASSLVRYGQEAARKEKLKTEFIEGDMRTVAFTAEFDACFICDSFVFSDGRGAKRALATAERALKKGGQFYLCVPNPLRKMRQEWRSWDRVDDGYLIMKSSYDPTRSVVVDHFRYFTSDGNLISYEAGPGDEALALEWRLYTFPEMVALLKSAHLRFSVAYGSLELPTEEYTVDSRNLVVVAKKAGR